MASSAGEYSIRRATVQDSEALYRVCLLTGDSGKDGTDLYRDDPKALGEVAQDGARKILFLTPLAGRIYTQPYLELSPVRYARTSRNETSITRVWSTCRSLLSCSRTLMAFAGTRLLPCQAISSGVLFVAVVRLVRQLCMLTGPCRAQMESEYLPALRGAFPLDTIPTAGCTPAQSVHRSYHDAHDGRELPKSLVELFPSHLHIDLEPRAQVGPAGQRRQI